MELSAAIQTPTVPRTAIPLVVEDGEIWNALICQIAGGNILQSFEWGTFKSRFGWTPLRVALSPQSTPVAAQVLFRWSPLGQIAYVPRGPVITPGGEAALADFLAELHRLARQRGAFFLKIEPELPNDRSLDARFRTLGFQPAEPVQPRSTLLLDLRTDEHQLLAQLNPRTRYNVGLATRRGVSVQITSENDLPVFYQLLVETSQRHHFPIHPYPYYRALWRNLASGGHVHLLIARYQSEVLSGALLLTMGNAAYYMYGGSSSRHRNSKPSDLLQWEAIRWARRAGCASYDLWGIPDEVCQQTRERTTGTYHMHREHEDPSRDLWGVYYFKRGFGGRPVQYVGAYDYVYSRPRYWLWHVLSRHIRPLYYRLYRSG